jgi:hypothetical protein
LIAFFVVLLGLIYFDVLGASLLAGAGWLVIFGMAGPLVALAWLLFNLWREGEFKR